MVNGVKYAASSKRYCMPIPPSRNFGTSRFFVDMDSFASNNFLCLSQRQNSVLQSIFYRDVFDIIVGQMPRILIC